jgi:hypothetical protein
MGSLRGFDNEISAEVALRIFARKSIVASGLGLSVRTSTVHQINLSSLS